MVISNFLYFFENSSLFLKKKKIKNNIKISNKIKLKLINTIKKLRKIVKRKIKNFRGNLL